MSNITAKILCARRVTTEHGTYIVGEVFGDTKGRFDDGSRIWTSYITHEDGPIISTSNSIYEVHWLSTARREIPA